MIVKTKHSIYRVTPLHTNFEVEKIAEITPIEVTPNEHWVEIGWKRVCRAIAIRIDEPAFFGYGQFGGVYTSEVTEVYDESPLTQH